MYVMNQTGIVVKLVDNHGMVNGENFGPAFRHSNNSLKSNQYQS